MALEQSYVMVSWAVLLDSALYFLCNLPIVQSYLLQAAEQGKHTALFLILQLASSLIC